MLTTLEKIKLLEQYLSVDNSTVDPVLDKTINKLLERERARVLQIKDRLSDQYKGFEKNYSLGSEEFYARYKKGEMGDEMDFIEWAATAEMLANLEKQLSILEIKPDNESNH